MRTAFVVGHGVDFIHDNGAYSPEIGPALLCGEQDVQRFRGSDQDVRRALEHQPALGWERVSRAHGGAHLGAEIAAFESKLLDLRQRLLQVLADVVGEGLERRNVDNFCDIVERAVDGFADELVDAGQESGKRFTRSGGSGDEGRIAGEDGRPALYLRFGGCAEAGDEPLLDDWVRPCQCRGNIDCSCGDGGGSHKGLV